MACAGSRKLWTQRTTSHALLLCSLFVSGFAHPNLLPGLRRLGLGQAHESFLPALKTLGMGIQSLSHTFRLRGGDATKGPSGIWDTAMRNGVSGAQFAILTREQPDQWNATGFKRRSQSKVRFVVNCSSATEETTLFAEGSWGADSAHLEDVVRIPLKTSEDTYPLWVGEANLKPGGYLFNYLMIQTTEEGGTHVQREEAAPRELQIFPSTDPHAVMLATDLDGTVVGDNEACEAFFRVWNDEYKPQGAKLVYNTGRPFDSAMRLINKGEIERPAVLICSEGTQVFWFESQQGDPVVDVEWQQRLNSSWEYEGLVNFTDALHEKFREDISNYIALAHQHGQPMIVLGVRSRETTETIVDMLVAQAREELGFKFDLIQSSSGHEWYVLVVPPGAGKGSAALHCASKLGFEPSRLMVSGDGENDVPLFESMAAGARGALVGNAVAGLRAWVDGNEGRYVIAERTHARGILDGLKHHFSYLGYTHAKDVLERTDLALVKVSVGSDTRLIRVKPPLSYASIGAAIRSRFEMPPKLDIRMRYVDKDGDLVTLASEEDAAEVEVKVGEGAAPLRVVVTTSWNECLCCGKSTGGSTLN